MKTDLIWQRAEAKHVWWWQKLCARYPKLHKPMPRLVLNKRLKTTAGRCFYETRVIDLSYDLLMEYPQEFYFQTIPHELCHQVAWDLYAEPQHGKPWKDTMLGMGLEPDIYHNMTNTRWAARKAKV